MSDRPSDGFTFDELREEYDWMSDFMGRMTERIRGNADVHSLAAYVGKLEAENAKLREQSERLRTQLADVTESVGRVEERCAKTFEVGKRWMAKAARFEAENAKLRELVSGLEHCCQGFDCDCCPLYDPSGTNHRRCESLERELGVDE